MLEYINFESINRENINTLEELYNLAVFRITKLIIHNNKIDINYCPNISTNIFKKKGRIHRITEFIRKIIQDKQLSFTMYIYDQDEAININLLQSNYNYSIDLLLELLNKINSLPLFVIYGNKYSNHILIPDHFILKGYDILGRIPGKSYPYNKYISKNDIQIEDKINKIVFSGRTKYKDIKKLHNGETILTNDYLNVKEQLNYKFLLGTYQRWDTLYWQLISNSVVFLLNSDYVLFYYYYFKKYKKENNTKLIIHVTEENVNDKFNQYKNKNKVLEDISKNQKEFTKKLTKDKLVEDYSSIIREYNKHFNLIHF